MGLIRIKKGLRLPISGEPRQEIFPSNDVSQVALLGSDYIGMRPQWEVDEGDRVTLGQVLFTDKRLPSVKYTSPGSGRVAAIHRGEKRAFLSVVIDLEGNDEVTFSSYSRDQLKTIDRDTIVSQLLASGLWTAIRVRPFSKVADPDSVPHSVFITAMDTNPLAPSVEKILEGQESDFQVGQTVLSRLTDGKVFVCKNPVTRIPSANVPTISVEEFEGPHPAGNVGTHIHFLDPVNRNKAVWYVGIQDAIAMGKLFTSGRLSVERVVALAGPDVKQPRLIRTRMGASLPDLTKGECKPGFRRIVSGSVFNGHVAEGANAFLGRYHQQITVLPESRYRSFLGWLNPGFDLFSVKNIVASRLITRKAFDFTTMQHGGVRALVPSGGYERVMPLDILPTYLLRALAAGDIDESERLGCLELDEEDLALCTFVCASKINHGENLRQVLEIIDKEGV